MHLEAYEFLKLMSRYITINVGEMRNLRVLEFGSHDVNGSPRRIFKNVAEYVGVDPWPGPGVDVMAFAQDYDGQGSFDLVISAECLEHDPFPRWQIQSACRALKPGGLLVITAAAPPRAPHRCDGMEGDLQGEHYANIDPTGLLYWLLYDFPGWKVIYFYHDRFHGDVQVLAERGGS